MENSDRIEDIKWLKAESGFGLQACFDMYKSCNEDKYEALRRLDALKASEPSNDMTLEEYEKFTRYREKYLEKDAKRITNEEWRQKHKHLQRPTVGRWIGTVIGLFFLAWCGHICAMHISDSHPWIFLLGIIPGAVGVCILIGAWFKLPETSGTYTSQKEKRGGGLFSGWSLVYLLGGFIWLLEDLTKDSKKK